jgi:hypothetical protein
LIGAGVLVAVDCTATVAVAELALDACFCAEAPTAWLPPHPITTATTAAIRMEAAITDLRLDMNVLLLELNRYSQYRT